MLRSAPGRRSLLYGLFLAAAGVAAGALPCDARTPNEAVCAAQTEHFNRQAGFPPHMLTAISLVESGRWNTAIKARVAWPWTVTSGSDGRFFDTREQALAHIAALRARGVTNIDVGCMQVNLHFHGSAFGSVEEALDPATNVAYAVTFLERLYEETRSWARSVTAYHSRTPVHAERYAGKLLSALDEAEESVTRRATLARGITPGRPATGQPRSAASPWKGYDTTVPAATLERYRSHTDARAREYLATWGSSGGIPPVPGGPVPLVPLPDTDSAGENSADSPPDLPSAPASPPTAPNRESEREQLEKTRQLEEEARISREKAEQWRSRVLDDWYRRKLDSSRSPPR